MLEFLFFCGSGIEISTSLIIRCQDCLFFFIQGIDFILTFLSDAIKFSSSLFPASTLKFPSFFDVYPNFIFSQSYLFLQILINFLLIQLFSDDNDDFLPSCNWFH